MFRKRFLIVLIVCGLLFQFSVLSFGAPANPTPFELVQPSGESFMARMIGDEFWHAVMAETGELIRQQSDSYWYYVEVLGGSVFMRAKYAIDDKPKYAVNAPGFLDLTKNLPIVKAYLPGQIGEPIVDISKGKITCLMPEGYDLTSLTPILSATENRPRGFFMTIKGYDSAQPQDFSKPVQYTIRLSDRFGSEVIEYELTVECKVMDENYRPFEINVPGQISAAIINVKDKTIQVESIDDLSGVIPTISSGPDSMGYTYSIMTLDESEKKYCIFATNSYESIVYSDIWTINYNDSQSIDTKYYRKLKLGDLNYDGVINSTDYVLARRALMTISNLAVENSKLFKVVDVNGDGAFNSIDLVLMRRYVLEIIEEFPCQDIEYLLGDLTYDGKHTDEDIEMLEEILSEGKSITPMLEIVADVNEDGVVDEKDLSLLIQIVNKDSLVIDREHWYLQTRSDLDGAPRVAKLYIKGYAIGDGVTITTSASGEIKEIELTLDENQSFEGTIDIAYFHLVPTFELIKANTTITAYSGNVKTTVIELSSPELDIYNDYSNVEAEAKLLALTDSDEILPPEELVNEIRSQLSTIRVMYSESIPQISDITYANNNRYNKGNLEISFDKETLKQVQDGEYSKWDELNYKYGLKIMNIGDKTVKLFFDDVLNHEKLTPMYRVLPGVERVMTSYLVNVRPSSTISTKMVNGKRMYLFYDYDEDINGIIYGFRFEDDVPEYLGCYENYKDEIPEWLIEYRS